MTNKQIETGVRGTKACAWGLYIFPVRRHCRKRLMSCSFSDAMGRCVTLLWGFSDCDPPPPNLKNPLPSTLPSPGTLFFPLRPAGEITLYFHCRSSGEPRWGPSSPRPWRSSPPSRLWCYHPSRSYRCGSKQERGRTRGRQKERRFC